MISEPVVEPSDFAELLMGIHQFLDRLVILQQQLPQQVHPDRDPEREYLALVEWTKEIATYSKRLANNYDQLMASTPLGHLPLPPAYWHTAAPDSPLELGAHQQNAHVLRKILHTLPDIVKLATALAKPGSVAKQEAEDRFVDAQENLSRVGELLANYGITVSALITALSERASTSAPPQAGIVQILHSLSDVAWWQRHRKRPIAMPPDDEHRLEEIEQGLAEIYLAAHYASRVGNTSTLRDQAMADIATARKTIQGLHSKEPSEALYSAAPNSEVDRRQLQRRAMALTPRHILHVLETMVEASREITSPSQTGTNRSLFRQGRMRDVLLQAGVTLNDARPTLMALAQEASHHIDLPFNDFEWNNAQGNAANKHTDVLHNFAHQTWQTAPTPFTGSRNLYRSPLSTAQTSYDSKKPPECPSGNPRPYPYGISDQTSPGAART